MVDQWNSGTSDSGTVKQRWWNTEQWDRDSGTSDGGTLERLMAEQWNI